MVRSCFADARRSGDGPTSEGFLDVIDPDALDARIRRGRSDGTEENV